MNLSLALADRGLIPDAALRFGIRRLLRQRLREQALRWGNGNQHAYSQAMESWLESMRGGPVAPLPDKANEQHYEIPPAFFRLALGSHLKYSSALYADPSVAPSAAEPLQDAEQRMLATTALRARLENGQQILELGCGWGSLTLWMAEHFPAARITAVSNSAPQRQHIESELRTRGLANVRVLTCDMNELAGDDSFPQDGFDRVISVEMFEHMRNWELLLDRIHGWLQPEGLFFAHVFAHKSYAYPFEIRSSSDWMSRYFFSGGIMPSSDLFERLEIPFESVERWDVDGRHYALTAEAWLANLDNHREAVFQALEPVYGSKTSTWIRRWRIFFLSCAELFGYADGSEWLVSHNLLRSAAKPAPLQPQTPAHEQFA